MAGVMDKLITWGLVIIGLIIITGPFVFVRRKYKPLCWRHILGAYGGSVLLFVIITESHFQISEYIFHSNKIIDLFANSVLASVSIFIFVFQFLLIISPFIVAKLKYKRLNWRKIIGSLLVSIVFLAISVGTWMWIAVLAGQAIFENLN